MSLKALLAAILAVPSLASPNGNNDWIPVDDPDLGRLPAALRSMPGRVVQAFESASRTSFFIARHLEGEDILEAFIADETLLSASCELIPVDERELDAPGGEGMVFNCELTLGENPGRASALYAPRSSGGLVALLIVVPGEPSFADLGRSLDEVLPHFEATVEPTHRPRHDTTVLDHRVSFNLTGGTAEESFALTPVSTVRDADYEFFKVEMDGHATFKGACVRQWADSERGITLSYQLIQNDQALGLMEPLVQHIARELQKHERVSEDDGDVPVELLHLPNARTRVVSDAEVKRHYRNNRLSREAGVILQTFIPRSPFARATRLRWTEGEPDSVEHVLALYVEMRSYPRVRSETVTRSSIVMLQGRARTAADLALLEQNLAFESRVLESSRPVGASR